MASSLNDKAPIANEMAEIHAMIIKGLSFQETRWKQKSY